MNIGIHAVAAASPSPTGVEYYARELIQAMLNHPDAQPHRFFLYANRELPDDLSIPRNATPRTFSLPLLWTQVRLSLEMLRHSPDVLFVPTHSLPRIAPKRRFAVIHGLEFEHYPRLYSKKALLRLRLVTRDTVRRATGLVTLSEAVKGDLINFYRVIPENVFVIPPGLPAAAALLRAGSSKNETTSSIGAKNYFLFIGRLETKKNIDGLVRAYALFVKKLNSAPPELVVAGRPGFGYEKIERAIRESSARGFIRVPGYINEEQKRRLLSNALAFVFPSWAEGFGFPIIEAQAAGVPVITGKTSSMPETAGDGALFTDVSDEALAEALRNIYDDESLRASLVERGRQNLPRFSWERAAQQTLNVITS